MTSTLPGAAAIVGIGQTEFSKESGRSELQLACEAVSSALDDAGLGPGDVDGMVMFTMDSSDEIEIARNVGMRGTSHNQVDNVEHVLVTSGTGVPTSGLILARAG